MGATSENRREALIDAAIGAAARRIRIARGLTLAQVVERTRAAGSGMHVPTLSTLENGSRRWTTSYIEHLCVALEVDPLEFFTDLLPPDEVQLLTAFRQAGAAGVAGWLAERLK